MKATRSDRIRNYLLKKGKMIIVYYPMKYHTAELGNGYSATVRNNYYGKIDLTIRKNNQIIYESKDRGITTATTIRNLRKIIR